MSDIEKGDRKDDRKMSERTVVQMFRVNLKYLAKRKGIMIKDIEKQVMVSQGYFSRAFQNDFVSLETAYAAAKAVGANLQEMIEKDFEQEQTIQDLMDEIEQLQKRLNTMMKEMEGIGGYDDDEA